MRKKFPHSSFAFLFEKKGEAELEKAYFFLFVFQEAQCKN